MAVDLLNVKGLQALDPSAPVVMVNLMRFRERSLDGDGSGWDAYLRYSALTVPMIKARGGTLLWTGDAKAVALGQQDGNQWDYLALVYYPTVAAVHRHDDVGRLRAALRSRTAPTAAPSTSSSRPRRPTASSRSREPGWSAAQSGTASLSLSAKVPDCAALHPGYANGLKTSAQGPA